MTKDHIATRVATIGALFGTLAWQGAVADILDDLQPGHWLEIIGSELENHDPEDDPAANPNYPFDAPWRGFEGQPGVINDWSSATMDTLRDRLALWGGGHSGYAGNEVYVFDMPTLTWERITNPAVDVSVNETWYYNDGTPRARESYNYLEYIPPLDRMITFGGGNLYPGAGARDTTTELASFNFDTLTWDYSLGAHSGVPWRAYATMVVYDNVTGLVWMKQPGYNNMHRWDPVANVWTSMPATQHDAIEYHNAVIDERNRYFLWTGRTGALVAYDLDNPTVRPTARATGGDVDIESVDYPGLAWDPVSERIIGWLDGGDVHVLDTDTWIWTRIAPAPTNTVIPTPRNFNGTNGRWRYVPSRDAFVLVNRVEDNVFFYKLDRSTFMDSDGDGFTDATDNCTEIANPTQCDTDGDGYGNHCDADLNNSGLVNSFDLQILRANFGATGPNDADFNCDDSVNTFDLSAMRTMFGLPPGPSGTAP